MMLEETGLAYSLMPVNLGSGDHLRPDFRKISPNNRLPAIIDHAPTDGGEPVSVFESGAILVYLAERTGRLLPADARQRASVLGWLFWQSSGLGPTVTQHEHFGHYAGEHIDYAIARFHAETRRLQGVLDRQLAAHPFVAGEEYSIADIAIYPWIVPWLDDPTCFTTFPNVKRWFEAVGQRRATRAAYARADTFGA
jgi:GSH-dependent disulfide-bond oxidoreductase